MKMLTENAEKYAEIIAPLSKVFVASTFTVEKQSAILFIYMQCAVLVYCFNERSWVSATLAEGHSLCPLVPTLLTVVYIDAPRALNP